jgi:hypothetical protein
MAIIEPEMTEGRHQQKCKIQNAKLEKQIQDFHLVFRSHHSQI